MPRVALLYRTDVHVSDKSPASWKADYPSEVWSNIERVGVLAGHHEVQAVLDGGDYFHVKAPTRNSHSIVARTAKIHLGYPCKTFSIEGNHDLSFNNLDSLERQPLGVLYQAGIFERLREQTFVDGSVRVRVVGVPYNPGRTLEDLQAIRKVPGDGYLVAVIHALAAEDPPAHVEDFFGEPVFRYRDLIYPDGPDLLCFGHWHRDQGVVRLQGRYFVNQGALSRGALIRENLERVPKASLLEFEPSGIKISEIPMSVAPASEVFDLERKERYERERQDIDQFIEKLMVDSAYSAGDTIEDNLRVMDMSNDVREMALSYLGRARGEAQGET